MSANGANKEQLLLNIQGEQLTLILSISSYWAHYDNNSGLGCYIKMLKP